MWRGNEDAGDFGMMSRAEAGVNRPFKCSECGYHLGAAEDFEGEEDGSAGYCPDCEEKLEWAEIDTANW